MARHPERDPAAAGPDREPPALARPPRVDRAGLADRQRAHRPRGLGGGARPQLPPGDARRGVRTRVGDVLVSDRGERARRRGRGARVDLLWDSGSEATLWRDGEVLQGLYSGWRALRTDAPVLEPAAGGERVELAVEMACNSWAGRRPGSGPRGRPGARRPLPPRAQLERGRGAAACAGRLGAAGAVRARALRPRGLAAALGPRDPAPTRGRGRRGGSMRTGRGRCSPS